MNAMLNNRVPAATRRQMVIGSAVVGGSLLVGACSTRDMISMGTPKRDFGAFGPFIRIDPDGTITVLSKHIEFGQGTATGLAAIVAEEMDADWDNLHIALAPGDTKAYANTIMGVQGTGGSTAMNEAWDQMRKSGAAARAMFVQGAAAHWSVPAGEISVSNGVVAHAKSGRSAPFAELLPAAAKVTPPLDPVLKDPKTFSLIGTGRIKRKDSLAKSTGTQTFTQDVYEPGMLTAVVLHSPRFGGKLKSFDATAAKKVSGVVDVFAIPTGVAVVANGVYAARQGRDALAKVQWDDSHAEMRSSEKMLADYKTLAAGHDKKDWAAFVSHGDATNAFSGEGVHAFTYDFPYLAHAAMEPMNCVASVDGNRTKLKFASQTPSLDQMNTALVVGNLPGAIEIETLFAGGSFGRRSSVDSDYVVEAVHIAKHVGKGTPIKLMWTREDDMTAGKYRPMAHHDIKVKVDAQGYPVAWRHRIVVQSFIKGTAMASFGVRKGVDNTTVEGVMGSPYLKTIPVVDAQVATPASAISTLWWRSVGATHTAMAMEHTIDQLAAAAKIDPLEYRRTLYTRAKADRHLAVMNLAAKKAGWGKPLAQGWGRGIAVHESFGTVVAHVVEAKMDGGQPKVRRAVVAIDCGVAVNPNQVAAQMEGGLCFGLSAGLYGQVTLKDGLVQQQNFDTYRVLRMNEAPAIETHILPSGAHPTGAGEPGTPVIIPAVANALLASGAPATSSLPMVKG